MWDLCGREQEDGKNSSLHVCVLHIFFHHVQTHDESGRQKKFEIERERERERKKEREREREKTEGSSN